MRDIRSEEETIVFGETPLYCFKRLFRSEIPSASVWLTEKTPPGILSVSNVLPTEMGQLSYDEYNTIVSEFYEKIVQPIADKILIEATLTSPEILLKDFLSTESSKLLRTFSSFSNK